MALDQPVAVVGADELADGGAELVERLEALDPAPAP